MKLSKILIALTFGLLVWLIWLFNAEAQVKTTWHFFAYENETLAAEQTETVLRHFERMLKYADLTKDSDDWLQHHLYTSKKRKLEIPIQLVFTPTDSAVNVTAEREIDEVDATWITLIRLWYEPNLNMSERELTTCEITVASKPTRKYIKYKNSWGQLKKELIPTEKMLKKAKDQAEKVHKEKKEREKEIKAKETKAKVKVK